MCRYFWNKWTALSRVEVAYMYDSSITELLLESVYERKSKLFVRLLLTGRICGAATRCANFFFFGALFSIRSAISRSQYLQSWTPPYRNRHLYTIPQVMQSIVNQTRLHPRPATRPYQWANCSKL